MKTPVSVRAIGIGLTAMVLLTGCRGERITSSAPRATILTVLVAEPHLQLWPSAPLSLSRATLHGDTLEMDASYAGGCATHEFGLVISSNFRESAPVQTLGLVAHEDFGDPCEAAVSETLRADLEPLKTHWQASYQQVHGAVRLSLAVPPRDTVVLLYEF